MHTTYMYIMCLLHRFGLPQRPDVLAVVRDELRPVAHDKAAPVFIFMC